MSSRHEATPPYWAAAPFPTFLPIARGERADVVVVGGGITGLTAAYLLAKGGRQVVLLERHRCAAADTGHTTAHLTMVTDERLTALVRLFGRSHAQAAWDAGLAAVAQIEEIVTRESIDAGFGRVDGYLHAPAGDNGVEQTDALRADAELASDFGFDVEFVGEVPLIGTAGMRVAHQARVHPRAYLAGLAKAVVDAGGRIFERSEVSEFIEQPRGVRVNDATVSCDQVVIATHNPLVGWGGTTAAALFQTKLALYTSYAVAGRVPKGRVPDALWWDTADPYQYLRVEPRHDHDRVILGGRDHKTGQVQDTEACFAQLRSDLASLVPDALVDYQWSGQVIETPDGLPYIGSSGDGQYMGTGFAGNGMTFGTLTAMISADALLGRRNPWAELFEPGRKIVARGLWDYLKENADYPYYMVRNRFAGGDSRDVRAIRPSEGAIVEWRGQQVAAYRDADGSLTLKSAVCPHMGCRVAWNGAEHTWDCPCHGSRFAATGAVLSGPAESPLADLE